jgi:CheY-like chemotaxis protein
MSLDIGDKWKDRADRALQEGNQVDGGNVAAVSSEASDAVQEALILGKAIVMVVDDQEEMSAIIARHLRYFGVSGVIKFCNSRKALQAIYDPEKDILTDKMPHLVLSDTEMPGMKGDALFRELDAIFDELKVPLDERPFYCAMSGAIDHPNNQSSRAYYEAHSIPVLIKPISEDELSCQVIGSLKRHPKLHNK